MINIDKDCLSETECINLECSDDVLTCKKGSAMI